jgi:3-oxoisoapionate decarboxylase
MRGRGRGGMMANAPAEPTRRTREPGADRHRMRIGIGSYTFAWHAGAPGYPVPQPWAPGQLLDAAIALGAEVVQYCENLSLETLDARALETLRGRARDADIAIEVGTRGLRLDRLRRCGELARYFGSGFIRLVIDDGGIEPTPGEAVDALREAAGALEPLGVRLAIENHDRFTAGTLVQMVEAIGPDRAGICLDTANSLGSLEGTEHVVRAFAPYVLSLHLKDIRIRRVPHNLGFIVSGTALGEGQIDTPWILATLAEHGRAPNAIVELWPAPDAEGVAPLDREWAMARQSLSYLRRVTGRAVEE